MFKIGDFSRLAQVSVKTLRYYDQLGLLKPAWIDRFTDYRYYRAEQLPRLNRILALKDLGFSLEQIRQALQENLAVDELRGMMRLKQAELERQVRQEQARLERVEARLRQMENEGALPVYEVVIKNIPAQRVLGIRQRVAGLNQVGELFRELHADLQSILPDPYCYTRDSSIPWLAIYYDPEYREEGIDVEAAAPLSRLLAESPGRLSSVQVHELPGAETMACVIHHGAYDRLGQAYNALLTWIEANGYRTTGPNREMYLAGLESLAASHKVNPPACVAEVQFPVEKKPATLLLSSDQEKRKMEPKIVSKPAFTAVGLLYEGKNENNEIAQMWQEFNPRINEIKHCVDGAFGLCLPYDEQGNFKYLASMAVSSTEDVPHGMVVWQVPAQHYAVFPCTLPTLGETYRYAFETWLPASGYEYTKGADFEYYDENFDPEKSDSLMFIYIPIQ